MVALFVAAGAVDAVHVHVAAGAAAAHVDDVAVPADAVPVEGEMDNDDQELLPLVHQEQVAAVDLHA